MTLKKNLVAKYAVRFNKSKKIKSKKQKLKDRNKKHKNVTDESSMDETPRGVLHIY